MTQTEYYSQIQTKLQSAIINLYGKDYGNSCYSVCRLNRETIRHKRQAACKLYYRGHIVPNGLVRAFSQIAMLESCQQHFKVIFCFIHLCLSNPVLRHWPSQELKQANHSTTTTTLILLSICIGCRSGFGQQKERGPYREMYLTDLRETTFLS